MELRLERLLKQLRREFIKVNFLQSSLDAIAIFLCSNLAVFLIGLNLMAEASNLVVLAFLSFLFFLADLLYRTKRYRLEIFEEKNPELQEALRTARDNKHRNDIASQSLFDEVIKRADNVKSESIVPAKVIGQKIVLIGILAFLTVVSGLGDVQIIESSGGAGIIPSVEEITENQKNRTEKVSNKRAERIYGEKDDIEISEQLLDFQIQGEGDPRGEVNLTAAQRNDFTYSTPERIIGEDYKLARKYNIWIRSRD